MSEREYQVTVTATVTGEMTVYAESEDDARDEAENDILLLTHTDIDWNWDGADAHIDSIEDREEARAARKAKQVEVE